MGLNWVSGGYGRVGAESLVRGLLSRNKKSSTRLIPFSFIWIIRMGRNIRAFDGIEAQDMKLTDWRANCVFCIHGSIAGETMVL